MHLYLIIGHQRPIVDFPPEFQFVTSQPLTEDDFVIQTNLTEQLGLLDKRIGEYAFLFAARRTFGANLKTITIAQYRRFVSCHALGTPSANSPFARILSAQSFQQIVTSEHFQPIHGSLMTSALMRLDQGVMPQYARHHFLRDWLRFCADSIDAGALSNEEALGASNAGVLIPAPSNGVFPAEVLATHLTRLEEMALAFLNSGFKEYSDYQRRSIGFCLERMHSYLILKFLVENKLNPFEVAGHHVVLSEETEVKPTI